MTQSTTSQAPIIFYSKTDCPWSRAVRHVLDQHNLSYDERPIDQHPHLTEELRRETGQEEQPTLKIGSEWLIDTDAKQVAQHLGLPEPKDVKLPA